MIAEEVKCKKCGTPGKILDNQTWNGRRVFDEHIRFKVVCEGCGANTSFYKTMDQAELAWEKRNAA